MHGPAPAVALLLGKQKTAATGGLGDLAVPGGLRLPADSRHRILVGWGQEVSSGGGALWS